jgi:hypothetical protein
MNRNRIIYFILLIIVIFLGLASRHDAKYLPQWNYLYVGDALWAMMVYVLFGLIFKNRAPLEVVFMALAFSYCIEISQLYHAVWIDSVRATWLGGHILGFGFSWSDMICYTVGIGLMYLSERIYYSRS